MSKIFSDENKKKNRRFQKTSLIWYFNSRFVLKTTKLKVFVLIIESFWRNICLTCQIYFVDSWTAHKWKFGLSNRKVMGSIISKSHQMQVAKMIGSKIHGQTCSCSICWGVKPNRDTHSSSSYEGINTNKQANKRS